MRKDDCMAILPTGYGKSLPFQLFPAVASFLPQTIGLRRHVVVCCPLRSLMEDQVEFLSKIPDITAGFKGSDDAMDQLIKDGCIDIIYASPESLLGDPEWREFMRKLKVAVIVVDEFHTISTWGEDSKGTEKCAFRKWFGHIGELRSMYPEASMLALSATCTLKVRKRVMKILSLRPETTVTITVSPNRPNIKLTAVKVSNILEMAMSWIVDGLSTLQETFPRTLIYCRSITDVSKLYAYISEELPECVQHLEMFHSETTDSSKEKVLDAVKNKESPIRLIIATSALGMGIDFVDLHSVVLYGPPNTNLELIQEVGRAGRDGDPSVALILSNSYHLHHVDSEVKAIFTTSECRRVALMSSFLNPPDINLLMKETGKHTCCDICYSLCKCKECEFLPLEQLFQAPSVDEESASEKDSDVTEDYNLSDYEDILWSP
ncbi:bifunctional 3'-5' exonuclease/ATP-dependent helicase WRN-like [Argopecten irradians]|uniref:bifunctional 3'-5' exonuclease/ATP-dependent helicase WRN-like n=1 Tax=Argopecten irradians TaxID=31199 RepID=UPI003720E6E6